MTAAAIEALPVEQPAKQWRVDWSLVVCALGALLLILAAVLSANPPQIEPYLTELQQRALGAVAFGAALVAPVFVCWRQAIRDNQLPAKNGLEPQYEHVSGWSAVFLVTVIALIAWLVWWAAQSDDANRKIHALWGIWVVVGLTTAFVVVATAPILPRVIRTLGLEQPASRLSATLNAPIEWIGRTLSVLDSMLVFAVANSAGTNRRSIFVRYGVLLSVIGACATLGYFWPPPWAFVPIAWGFIVAFSVSRRWAWIEQDRELAMLNSTISQAHIRVGFGQNLRDEALVAFLSMFLLVPLALRQAQLYADARDIPLFALSDGADINSLLTWVAFYGTELAKAVPFVDWAEIYHVEGNAAVQAQTDLAQHAVFLTRVLIDLVFLAALLQAISSSSRDAQQKDLFYRKQSIHRLDPFTEPDAFRALVRRGADGQWEPNGEKFDEFPRHYDANRLVELTASPDERVARAANFLLDRDGVESDPHSRLSAKAADRGATAEEIALHLDAIESAGPERNPYQLALARRRLLSRKAMADVRARIVTLIAQSPSSFDRTDRLIEAMVGEQRESYQRARIIALDALAPDTGINLRVRSAVQQAANHDGAQAVRKRAQSVLSQHPDVPE